MTLKELSEFVHELNLHNIPPNVIEHCKMNIADTIGVTVIGSRTADALKSAEMVSKLFGTNGKSTVLANKIRTCAAGAAFANGVAAHSLLFDDQHNATMLHPGCAVIPALLAVAEERRLSGAECLASILAGYEVAIRISASIIPSHYDSGFAPTGTINSIAIAAAVAKLIGCSSETIGSAMSIAAQGMGGMRFYQKEGKTEYAALLNSNAAYLGILAAMLASEEYTKPIDFLEMDEFYKPITRSQKKEAITQGLSKQWRILETTFKPYPTNRLCHGPVTLLLKIFRENKVNHHDIERVEVGVNSQTTAIANIAEVDTPSKAVFSLQYNIAAAAIFGKLTVDELSPRAVLNPELQQFLKIIKVYNDEESEKSYPRKWLSTIRVIMKKGQTLSGTIDWLVRLESVEEVKLKFYNNMTLLSRERIDRAWQLIQDFENVKDTSQLWTEGIRTS